MACEPAFRAELMTLKYIGVKKTTKKIMIKKEANCRLRLCKASIDGVVLARPKMNIYTRVSKKCIAQCSGRPSV